MMNTPIHKAIRFSLHHGRESDGHLAKSIVETIADRVRRIASTTGPEYYDESSLPWKEQVERWVRACLVHGGTNFDYPLHEAPPPVWLHEVSVSLSFRMPKFNKPGPKIIELPAMMADAKQWMGMSEAGNLDFDDVKVMQWFLSKLHPMLPILEPGFGFGDTESAIFKNLESGTDPRDLAWPSMILGPDAVKKLGHDRVATIPAWKVETLPYGGVWIQVSEHPFQSPKSELAKVAAHLGVEPRK